MCPTEEFFFCHLKVWSDFEVKGQNWYILLCFPYQFRQALTNMHRSIQYHGGSDAYLNLDFNVSSLNQIHDKVVSQMCAAKQDLRARANSNTTLVASWHADY